MKRVPLGEVTEPIQTWTPSRHPDSTFTYMDLSSVDNQTKTVVTPVRLLGREAPSRARQLVQSGDVLVSTVRPNLNAVAVVDSDLAGATASTGFTVLRPNRSLDTRYLFHWVRGAPFISDMVRKATGASYPAVSDRLVKESALPLPDPNEQRRIAAILDKADSLRNKRRVSVNLVDGLKLSIFLNMFGDPDKSVGQQSLRFGEVADLQGGRNLVADDEEASTPYRVLKISAVTTGTFKPAESKPLPVDYTPPTSHLVNRGDLLISRANTAELVGAVAYVDSTPPNLVLPDKVWRFVWHNPASVPLYYWALFRTPAMRRRVSQLSSGTGGSMKNISKAKLEQLELPSVDIAQQREFEKRVAAIPIQTITQFDELFASLQSRAFSGRL